LHSATSLVLSFHKNRGFFQKIGKNIQKQLFSWVQILYFTVFNAIITPQHDILECFCKLYFQRKTSAFIIIVNCKKLPSFGLSSHKNQSFVFLNCKNIQRQLLSQVVISVFLLKTVFLILTTLKKSGPSMLCHKFEI